MPACAHTSTGHSGLKEEDPASAHRWTHTALSSTVRNTVQPRRGAPDPCHDWEGPKDTGLSQSSRTQKDPSRRSHSQEGPEESRRQGEERVGAGAAAGVGSPCFVTTESPRGDTESSGDGGWGGCASHH